MSMNWSYDVQCGNLGKSQALTNEYSTSMYIQCGWLSFVKLTVSAIWIFSRYVETAELHPRLNNTSYIKSQKKVANGSKNPCAQRYRYRDRKIIFVSSSFFFIFFYFLFFFNVWKERTSRTYLSKRTPRRITAGNFKKFLFC